MKVGKSCESPSSVAGQRPSFASLLGGWRLLSEGRFWPFAVGCLRPVAALGDRSQLGSPPTGEPNPLYVGAGRHWHSSAFWVSVPWNCDVIFSDGFG